MSARPLFKVGIDELVEMADDRDEWPMIAEELAFRKSRKAVKLAKMLNCQHKVSPSNREMTGEGMVGDAAGVFNA